MTDVFDRVRAMPVLNDLLPREPGAGSPFAEDAAHHAIDTYTVVRILLFEGMHRLQVAARTAQVPAMAELGTHILLLRPALVSTAKAAWIVVSEDSAERVSRAARLAAEDRRQGVTAMEKAVRHGAPEVFEVVGSAFQRGREGLLANVAGLTPHVDRLPPRDEDMIGDLGVEIDRYYGTDDARSSVQLLWNTSSSLAHGERWYTSLVSGPERTLVAEILTTRSLDVVCSALNVTSLRVLALAVARGDD